MADAKAGTLVGERLGKYELLSLLAVGGTAEIYLARIAGEAGFVKFVVVKCLLDHLADEPEWIDMFLDEGRLGAQLDHTNIVHTLELGHDDGRYFLAMEYLAGMSLATMYNLAQERLPEGLPLEQCLGLCAQACAGLHYAHERTTAGGRALDIIHRDVSPSNLVVSFEGVLKLVDFGLAKAAIRQTNTQSGTIKGKFAYMSPEQCLDKAIDRRTDIFALGVVLHELVTGHRLFRRDNPYDTYKAIVEGKVVPPSKINPLLDRAIDDLIMRALAYEPGDRYQTAHAFGLAIQQLLHKRGTSVGPAATARFIDKAFAPEVELHGERMRELVSEGRASMADITWNAPLGDDEGLSLRPETDEPLNFDAPREATSQGDYEDDQPTRLDPWAAVGLAEQLDRGNPNLPADADTAEDPLGPDDLRLGSGGRPGPGDHDTYETEAETDESEPHPRFGGPNAPFDEPMDELTDEATIDQRDESGDQHEPRALALAPPPSPARPAAPATLEPTPAPQPPPTPTGAGTQPRAEPGPVAFPPSAARSTISVPRPSWRDAARGHRWGLLALGFIAAAVIGLLTTSAVLALL